MNPNDATVLPPDDANDALAGEYVLGTLPAEARREVDRRMESEPLLRAAVDAWEERLHPLVALVEPVVPDPALWRRIEASVSPPPSAAPRAARASTCSSARPGRGNPRSRRPWPHREGPIGSH